ncbi:MAG: hypothetical protein DRQ55_16750 [Planctomycetota bacterium]|nr:MAG: hypothetical protein DRQ55_16750 [Planctomycetota bacterium]
MDWVLDLALALGAWMALGLVFGVAFVSVGITRVDPAAKGSSVRFRLLILPGVAALWPLLALRWMRAPRSAEQPP